MDAYVLGTHEGELPTHLLGPAGSGRVRAMAAVEGSPHTIYIAVDGDTEEALGEALAVVDNSSLHGAIHLVASEVASRHGVFVSTVHGTSHMPPVECIIFLFIEAESIEDAFLAALDALGPEGVAVAADGRGGFVVELGGDDPAAVEAAAEDFTGRHPNAIVARVTAGGLSHV